MTNDFDSRVALLGYMPSTEATLGRIAQTSRNKGYALPHNADFDAEKELKTLRFCVKSGHMSVLEFAQLVFRIETPIFVARQLMRYRAATYMERSLRYCSPEARVPVEDAVDAYAYHEEYAHQLYDILVSGGERKEVARGVLPLSTATVFIMRVDLRNLIHIFEERLSPHAQRETRLVVEQMLDHAQTIFPITIESWKEKNQ